MIKSITILLAGLILASCSGTSDPDPLQSKELDWKTGDNQVFLIERHTDSDTTFLDTTYVMDASVIDGYYTLYWSSPAQQARIRDGYYETRYDFDDVWDSWTSLARVPTTSGEVLYADTNSRSTKDGTPLGKFITECTTSSVDTTITVPAGTFRCMASVIVELHLTDRTSSDRFERRNWYAPGIGFVQIEVFEVTLTGGRQLRLQERIQLKSMLQ